jgi:hypothetical protein
VIESHYSESVHKHLLDDRSCAPNKGFQDNFSDQGAHRVTTCFNFVACSNRRIFRCCGDVRTDYSSGAFTVRWVNVFGGSTNKNANVQQFSCNNGANQRWEFVDLGGGQYAIRNVNSGQVLDVAGDSRANGANVQQFPWNGGANQRWKTRGSNNNFELINVNSGKCLEVQGGGIGNNVNIAQSQCNGARYQRWYAGYALPGGPSPR